MNINYPQTRFLRLRNKDFSRNLIKETQITTNDLICPYFITEGKNIKNNIKNMYNIKKYSVDELIKELYSIMKLNIQAIIIFPIINSNNKSIDGKESYNENGLVQNCIKQIKKNYPTLGIITDIALDPYTLHGHDGIINKNGEILNDKTIETLKKQALSHAKCGADIVAPSDMMDGRIGIIRNYLEKHHFFNTKILSYSVKYNSILYNPFRSIVTNNKQINKNTYQMDFCNSNEALNECLLDINEGTDMIMIKPSMYYLDIIYKIKKKFKIPTFAFQVSGEYSMLTSFSKKYKNIKKQIILESLTSIKRAGADAIITYFAKDASKIIKNQN